MICVGRTDKKAFYISTSDKKAFPEHGAILSLLERRNLKKGDKINMFWDMYPKPGIMRDDSIIVVIFMAYGTRSLVNLMILSKF
jgi:hypothetical protein